MNSTPTRPFPAVYQEAERAQLRILADALDSAVKQAPAITGDRFSLQVRIARPGIDFRCPECGQEHLTPDDLRCLAAQDVCGVCWTGYIQHGL